MMEYLMKEVQCRLCRKVIRGWADERTVRERFCESCLQKIAQQRGRGVLWRAAIVTMEQEGLYEIPEGRPVPTMRENYQRVDF